MQPVAAVDHTARWWGGSTRQHAQRVVDVTASQIQVSKAAGDGGHGGLGLALTASRVDADEQLRAGPIVSISPGEGLLEAFIEEAVGRRCSGDPKR
jgi:hypothetical protein